MIAFYTEGMQVLATSSKDTQRPAAPQSTVQS